MQLTFRISALALAIGALLAWAALGANTGWTRTSEALKTLDEVTGIEGIQYQKRFVPGLDLLGCALAGAGLVGFTSFFFRTPQTNNKHKA